MLKKSPEVDLVRFILEFISGGKTGENRGLLSLHSADWGRFKNLISYHDLAPFAYPALKDFDSELPEGLREFLKNNYYCALVRCQELWQEFLRISKDFQKAGISLLPIKGVALLKDLYAHRPLRPMTDMDLLVKEENIQKAEAIFSDLGYRKELYGLNEEYWGKSQCHITFYKKSKKEAPFVELHWGLDFKRKNRNILPELWSRVRGTDAEGGTVKLLSPEDTLFSLALHNRRFGRTLCLKNAYDAALLLNKYAADFDWGYVVRQAKKGKMRTTLFFLLCQVKLFSGIVIPGYVWEELKVALWKRRLIQQFIEKNTFSAENKQGMNLYLKMHFLIYDSFWEPISYIVGIPKEQFAKYYDLQPYDKRTNFLYRNRLLYIPFKAIYNCIHSRQKVPPSGLRGLSLPRAIPGETRDMSGISKD